MEVFRRWGSGIAISDFGSGHLNKLMLLSANPDFIKIDMSLVRNIHMDENKATIVKGMVSYAQSMEIKTVAQGIETKEELQALLSYGVDFIQGYFIGMPDYEAKGILRQAKEEICRHGIG
ncbi:Cyclic di-GMP phosphodiesterase CdpA [bioreactor metagenome]|uniref:Cyclic di-GMP phosphodiesterase CdpA n=1 Tax=bioreactor metagenome TaxID=1076179 RepID=A0A645DQD0_9ZZZZ